MYGNLRPTLYIDTLEENLKVVSSEGNINAVQFLYCLILFGITRLAFY